MSEYRLTKRTLEKTKELNEKIEMANFLTTVLALSPFIGIFASPTLVDTTFTLTTTDWDVFSNAVRGNSTWVRSELRHFCHLEEVYHATHNNNDDRKFWTKLKNTFN